jgi:CRP-like cAMP-binding protein
MIVRESSSKRAAVGRPSSRPETLNLQCEFENLGVVRSYSPGSELLQQGMAADDVYLIHDGTVKLVWTEARGKETIVGLRSRESFLGVPSVITAGPCPTSAVTLVRSVVERIPAEKFLDRLQTDSDLAWKINQIQSRELDEQLTWLGELACCSARSRLANVLRRLTAFNGTTGNRNTRVRLPLKRREMAELIAVTPEHLSRLLHALSKDGHIQFRNGWIIIPDPQALATL